MSSDAGKPSTLKPILWDKDSGKITPVDQNDWRIEGTEANRRVECLQRKAKLWQAISIVMATVLVWAFGATAVSANHPFGWMDVALIAHVVLTWACYFRSEYFRISLKALVEDW